MKKFWVAGLAGLVLGVSGFANAADLGARPTYKAPPLVAAPPVPFSWTGFFIGGHIGGGWGKKTWIDLGDDNSDNTSYNVSGVLGGVQAGFNYQIASLVAGVEGDFSWTGIHGSGPLANEAEPSTFDTKVRWISTLTGRLGFTPAGPVLIYVKGGGAWASDRHTLAQVSEGETPGSASVTVTRGGWTVGGGIQYAFLNNWSAKLEYDYIDLGHASILFAPLAEDLAQVHQKIHEIKFGINYHFGWGKGKAPVVAKY